MDSPAPRTCVDPGAGHAGPLLARQCCLNHSGIGMNPTSSVRAPAVLGGLVDAEFPFPAIRVRVGADPLGAPINLDVEAERASPGGYKGEAAIGQELVIVPADSHTVFATELDEPDSLPVGGNDRVDD